MFGLKRQGQDEYWRVIGDVPGDTAPEQVPKTLSAVGTRHDRVRFFLPRKRRYARFHVDLILLIERVVDECIPVGESFHARLDFVRRHKAAHRVDKQQVDSRVSEAVEERVEEINRRIVVIPEVRRKHYGLDGKVIRRILQHQHGDGGLSDQAFGIRYAFIPVPSGWKIAIRSSPG